MAKKVEAGPPKPHNCYEELPWPVRRHEEGTEIGSVWECSCGKRYRVDETGWVQVDENNEPLPDPRSWMDRFLDYWRW